VVLTPADYKLLGSHSAYSLAFVSNINSWLDVGYFAASSHEKWLLHTWSLSVEWQFYLLLPIGLCLVWKFFPSRKAVIICCWLIFITSFLFCYFSTPKNSSFAFFLLLTRAWEMLAGALVYLMGQKLTLSEQQKRIFETFGIF